MKDKELELIDFLEDLPRRRCISFKKDFQSDDYFTALGQLRKSINERPKEIRAVRQNEKQEDICCCIFPKFKKNRFGIVNCCKCKKPAFPSK